MDLLSKKRLGRQRQKYQAPVPEHPQTTHEIEDREIHASSTLVCV